MIKSTDTIVRATAGAGKTTGLLEAVYNTYGSFFKKEGVWPKILLSTFTVKAANELSERLISKAVDLKDDFFLDYVSSNFLEIGTLHSVFLKILDQISNEEGSVEPTYFSQSHRNKVGRAILHNIIKEEKAEDFFIEARDEKDVLSAFFHVYNSSNSGLKEISFKEVSIAVVEKLREYVYETDEEILVNMFNEGLGVEGFIDYLKSLESKERKKYKNLNKFVENDIHSQKFLKNYVKKHSIYKVLYKKWSVRFRDYIKENSISSIADAEVQVLTKLKESVFDKKIWDFCFFDEYQDTSPIQKKIIDIVSSQSVNYFVGDPFQSIYFFRGARKEIFLQDFIEIEKAEGQTEYRLNNYRSAPEIVDFVNGVTKFVLPDFMEMESFVEGVKGEVKLVHFNEGRALDEFLYVKEAIKKIDLNTESVAILSRGSKELLQCGKELRAEGIPHKFSLSKGFESSLEVMELVSLMKFLLEPDDDENLSVLLFSYWCSVSDVEIQSAVREVKKEESDRSSLWSVFQNHEGVGKLKKAFELVQSLPVSIVLSDFVGSSGFLDLTEVLDPTKNREHNTLKLIGALESEEAKRNFNVRGFCDDILSGNYRFESEEIKSDSGCLLMTIHGSKGLQFDHVFIIGMNKSNVSRASSYYFNLETNLLSLKVYSESESKMKFPLFIENLVSNEKNEILSENKRLFYVAMTRAKRSLSLIGSKKISKTSVAPSWLSLTLDFLKKTDQEDLYFEVNPFEFTEVDKVDLYPQGFLLKNDASDFLEKKSLAVTSLGKVGDKEYEGEVTRFTKMSLAISEGVLFHEMMERADSIESALEDVPSCFNLEHDKHKKAVEYLFEQKDFPFALILASGEKEWGFDFSGEGKKISGKIDLWARVGDEVWLVDYKTGGVSGAEKGFDQLAAYKAILEKHIGKNSGFRYNLVLTFPYEKKTFLKTNV